TYSNTTQILKLFVLMATADSLGLVHFSGRVSHSGKHGCCLWCGQPGQHREGQSMYCLVLFNPNG
ncbi:hypothetical protein GYMLUDRAFT_104475, partial [Collybiopsis luxurians FD-317 M1]